jgi:hypothetical protein
MNGTRRQRAFLRYVTGKLDVERFPLDVSLIRRYTKKNDARAEHDVDIFAAFGATVCYDPV